MEEGGDPLPHLSALDPLLAELTELEERVKKAPKEEVEDARYERLLSKPTSSAFAMWSAGTIPGASRDEERLLKTTEGGGGILVEN